MKILSSLPLPVKAAAGLVAGGTGVVGTGLIIHNSLQADDFQLKGLDKSLVEESESKFSLGDSDNFSIGNSSKEANMKVKASSTKTSTVFTGDKWTCTIKGKVEETVGATVTLTDTNDSGNFDKAAQKTKFKSKFDDSSNQKQYKEGFVKSCARNRSTTPEENANWTSEIVVLLKKPTTGDNGSQKYGFSDEDVEKIFAGNWINPK